MSYSATTRPRRTRNTPAKAPITVIPAAGSSRPSATKRKTRDSDADTANENHLEQLLTSSKSRLTTIDISDVLNYENFINLPQATQEQLCLLLPPTAFPSFCPVLDHTHPASNAADVMDVDASSETTPATLNPGVFSSSPFMAAAETFQDHLFSSWLSAPSKAEVDKFKKGTADGSLRAEWKDEAWQEEAQPHKRRTSSHEMDLANLAKRSLIKEGDILVYRHTFQPPEVTVEKDLLVQSVDPKSHALNVLLQPSNTKALPMELLVIGAPDPTPPTLTMEGIFNSTELEDGILEVDGRVSRADVYTAMTSATTSKDADTDIAMSSIRTAKSITVWRWPEEMMSDIELQMLQARGGRELLATVYFLRNA